MQRDFNINDAIPNPVHQYVHSVAPATPNINCDKQSTHTASVHESVSNSERNLSHKYRMIKSAFESPCNLLKVFMRYNEVITYRIQA